MDDRKPRSILSRRQFGANALAASVAAAAGSFLIERPAEAAVNDIDILNFALNLEYLEAEFYSMATYGKRIQEFGIDIGGTGRPGDTTGGAKVALDDRTNTVAMHITLDEQQHVRFLRQAIGSAAITKPAINLDALGIGFKNQNEFLTLARAFEDVGVSAYGGAAPLISSRTILAAAAGIALTEGQHAGVLRSLVADAKIAVPQLDNKDVPPLGSPGGRLFQVDGNGLSTTRTPSEVLAIVFASSGRGASAGGFFPTGVNGTVSSV